MIIGKPICYSLPESSIIDAFNGLPNSAKKADYWSDINIKYIRKLIKDYYVVEQKYMCCYCGRQILVAHGRSWDVEHILSRSDFPHFMFEPKNLAVSCIECNSSKLKTNVLVNGISATNSYPSKSASFRIIHPHFDDYDSHIGVAIGKIYFAKTEKGWFTMKACNLGRFSYGYLGWDEGLDTNEFAIDSFNRMMDSHDPSEKRMCILNILMAYQITISKSLM